MNTNPYRATQNPQFPPELIIEENSAKLWTVAAGAALVVAAWGTKADKSLAARAKYVLKEATGDKLYVLELAKDGTPKHPLYLRKNLKPQWWNR